MVVAEREAEVSAAAEKAQAAIEAAKAAAAGKAGGAAKAQPNRGLFGQEGAADAAAKARRDAYGGGGG